MVAIADCITGASPTDIVNLIVTGGNRRRLRGGNDISLLSSVVASYIVSVTGSGISYDSVSSELINNVESGQFDNYLHSAAIAYGATGLISATSTSIATLNQTPAVATSTNSLTVGVIVGIVLAGVCCVGLIVALEYFCRIQLDPDSVKASPEYSGKQAPDPDFGTLFEENKTTITSNPIFGNIESTSNPIFDNIDITNDLFSISGSARRLSPNQFDDDSNL
jgi:hypothetical protein